MAETLSKRRARSVARLSSGVTQSLIEIATDANTAYLEALRQGASQSQLHALAAAGLDAAQRLHANIETIIDATIQARTSRWRSREKADAQVRATLGPRLAATAQAIQDWTDRLAQHAGAAAAATKPVTPQAPPVAAAAPNGTIRHVPLMSDGSGVTFECQHGQWVWRFDPGVPENVTTTALVMAELNKLHIDAPTTDDTPTTAADEQ